MVLVVLPLKGKLCSFDSFFFRLLSKHYGEVVLMLCCLNEKKWEIWFDFMLIHGMLELMKTRVCENSSLNSFY